MHCLCIDFTVHLFWPFQLLQAHLEEYNTILLLYIQKKKNDDWLFCNFNIIASQTFCIYY